jgi:hypothetical protein
MPNSKATSCFAAVTRGLLTLLLAIGIALAAPVTTAEDVDATLKSIERSLGGINSRVSSEPTRAEKEYLAAAEKLQAAKASAPDHPSIAKIEKKMQAIAAKLEKRLRRPIRGVAAEPEKPAAAPAPKAGAAKPTKPVAAPAQPAPAAAGTATAATKLPGGVTSRLKDINKSLAAVDDALAKGDARKMRSVERNLKTAERKMGEIQKNYGDKIPPGHPDVTAAEQRLAKARTDLDAALASADAEAAQASAAAAARRDAMIAAQNELAELRRAAFKANDPDAVAKARADFEAFKAAHATDYPPDHEAIQDVEKVLAESESQVGARTASSGWIEKLRPYVASGSDRMLIASATANPKEIVARKAIYGEAAKIFEEFRAAAFPSGKSPELEAIEQELAAELEAFPTEHAKSLGMVLERAGAPLDQDLAGFEADQTWRDDPKALPHTVDAADMAAHRERIDAIEPAAGDDSRFAALRKKLAALAAADAERRQVRAQRTFLRPDGFGEAGLDAIKAKAAEIVPIKAAGAKVLRITVPSAAWKEEDVEEWTDSTKTKLRRRITRSVTAEVAARQGDIVFRHVLYVAKDKRSDGTWGALYGHIMFTDPMAEANVKRGGP